MIGAQQQRTYGFKSFQALRFFLLFYPRKFVLHSSALKKCNTSDFPLKMLRCASCGEAWHAQNWPKSLSSSISFCSVFLLSKRLQSQITRKVNVKLSIVLSPFRGPQIGHQRRICWSPLLLAALRLGPNLCQLCSCLIASYLLMTMSRRSHSSLGDSLS